MDIRNGSCRKRKDKGTFDQFVVRLPFGPIFVRPVRPFVRPSAVRPLRPVRPVRPRTVRFVRFVRFVRHALFGWEY
uniref:Uncharacterized protein n=1 Tax=Caenorhabditis japonica TaxID=281687 RepID=A0A8R1IPL3_CAEJA